MLHRRGRLLPIGILVILDAVLISVSFALSWWIRYELQLGREVAEENYVGFDAYLLIHLSLVGILLFVFTVQGLYDSRSRTSWMDAVGVILSSTTIGVAIMIVVVFGLRPYAYSRLIFLYAWLLVVVLLSLMRLAEMQTRAVLRKRGIGLERVLVVGAGSQGMLIMQNIVAHPELGYNVVGFADEERDEDLGRFKALGRLDDVPRIVRTTDVDLVIIALPSTSHQRVVEIMMQCERHNVSFRIVPDFYELSLSKVDINEINGIPLIGLREVSIRGWNVFLKRLLDVACSAAILVALSPLLLLIGIAIKLDSPGPTLYTQTRVGRGGRHFVFYKFRSMRVGADKEKVELSSLNEASGPLFKIKRDPRLTRVGKVLRRLSLDEFPQFYNVLIGDMSLVGPRPPLPDEVAKYDEWHHKRLEISPGLTGLWQVSGRSNLLFDEMVLLDIWYIENWSLGLDLKIMLRTIPAVLLARGAY
ncbi:MAG: undecaprenyl-phosphate glucose phosphotransferase [Chloroflexi bacterium]|nr:undecaprenyl-phosphate glucose phosphotransferase [Chloroflexota bacterium]